MTVHPPKREVFDVGNRTNTDPKGIVRDVDVYDVRPWGLYMARPTPGRAQFHYLESWLLPDLHLRASVFHFSAGYERDQDYYLDVGSITVDDDVWHTEDHYLDLVVRAGRGVDVIDVDELLDAHASGVLDTPSAQRAMIVAVRTAESLARFDYDLGRWLESRRMVLSWRSA